MILIALALASAPLTKQESAAAALTPEQVAAIAEVTGTDALDPDIWVETRGFLPRQGNDRWFRARIDKATGAVEYQLYFIVEAKEPAFRPQSLTFMSPGGLATAKIDRISFEPTCYRSSGCWIKEHAIAPMTRADLEYAATGAGSEWAAKLFGQSDSGEILTFRNEIAGFLLAVDSQLAERSQK
jgi:hypothetical protein